MLEVDNAETQRSEVRASIEKLAREIQWQSVLSLSSLRTLGKPSENAEKVLMHFCESTIGTMVAELPINKSV